NWARRASSKAAWVVTAASTCWLIGREDRGWTVAEPYPGGALPLTARGVGFARHGGAKATAASRGPGAGQRRRSDPRAGKSYFRTWQTNPSRRTARRWNCPSPDSGLAVLTPDA